MSWSRTRQLDGGTRYGFDRYGFQHRGNCCGCDHVLGSDLPGARLPILDRGVILMVVGAIGLVISTIVYATSRRPAGGRRHAYDKQTIDTAGRSTEVHETAK